MTCIIVGYPRCTTCKRAENFLQQQGVNYSYRNIKEEKPSAQELRLWHEKSGLDLKKFFNTSGMLYRELGLKDKLPTLSDKEKIELLATDGMLVKRPILITDKGITCGFKEEAWSLLL